MAGGFIILHVPDQDVSRVAAPEARTLGRSMISSIDIIVIIATMRLIEYSRRFMVTVAVSSAKAPVISVVRRTRIGWNEVKIPPFGTTYIN